MKSSTSKSRGEADGHHASTQKYSEHARAFVESGKVGQVANEAVQRHAQDEMRQAEGRAHAKGQAGAGRDAGSPGRPRPDKKAPGKHPQGRHPVPQKLPGC